MVEDSYRCPTVTYSH